MKDSEWRFDKINSLRVYLWKTAEMNGSSYVKNPLRSSAILNIENNDKNCFIWSILASLHPFNIGQPSRVSLFRQYSTSLYIQDFDLNNALKCTDVNIFEKLNNLSINIFELSFITIRVNGNIIYCLWKLLKTNHIEMLTC